LCAEGGQVTDEELREADQFAEETLAELESRTVAVPNMTNAELARHLEFARQIDCYYICENGAYVKATVREAAKRLHALGEDNPAAH
jgi:hypothetical protein